MGGGDDGGGGGGGGGGDERQLDVVLPVVTCDMWRTGAEAEAEEGAGQAAGTTQNRVATCVALNFANVLLESRKM